MVHCTQIVKSFNYVLEQGKTANDAALLTGIHIRTAQHYTKEFNDNEKRCLPVSGRKPGAGRTDKLTESHSQFLIAYVDDLFYLIIFYNLLR
jgi:transposase